MRAHQRGQLFDLLATAEERPVQVRVERSQPGEWAPAIRPAETARCVDPVQRLAERGPRGGGIAGVIDVLKRCEQRVDGARLDEHWYETAATQLGAGHLDRAPLRGPVVGRD